MANVHTPERQPGETQEQYRARREQSKRIVRLLTKGPTQAPAISQFDTSRFFLGVHTNHQSNSRRRSIKALGGIRQFKRFSQAHRPDFDGRIPF